MPFLSLLLSLLPFLVFLIFLLWRKSSLLLSSLTAFITVFVLSVVFWQIIPVYLAVSLTKGVLVALDIFIIIFGALFLLSLLQKLGTIDHICQYLQSFSSDYRLQVLILAWFFEAFIEGTAGFGTPGAIVAPLLIGLGVPPINSVIISLIGNSTPGVFGAAGTPIRVGFAGLETALVPLYASLLNLVGIIIPVFILWILVSPRSDRKEQFIEALPFALWAGVALSLPSILALSLGQEFPSIVGSLIGLILVFITTRLKWFLPRTIRTLVPHNSLQLPPIFKVFFPYLITIFFLIIGKSLLGSIKITLPTGIIHSINLYNPGLAFTLAAIATLVLYRPRHLAIFGLIKSSFRKALEPFLVIAFMSSVVQIFIFSGQNYSGLPSALQILAESFKSQFLPLWTPFIGAFGAFVTGSLTLSNLMFGKILATTSVSLGFSSSWILALTVAGAGIGNMAALADILAAETVVGLKNHERFVLKGVIIPVLICLLLLGLAGLILSPIFS